MDGCKAQRHINRASCPIKRVGKHVAPTAHRLGLGKVTQSRRSLKPRAPQGLEPSPFPLGVGVDACTAREAGGEGAAGGTRQHDVHEARLTVLGPRRRWEGGGSNPPPPREGREQPQSTPHPLHTYTSSQPQPRNPPPRNLEIPTRGVISRKPKNKNSGTPRLLSRRVANHPFQKKWMHSTSFWQNLGSKLATESFRGKTCRCAISPALALSPPWAGDVVEGGPVPF